MAVDKLVVLKLGEGSLEQGFSVTLQIGDENAPPAIELMGDLPPNPDLVQAYSHWQDRYRNLDLPSRPIGLPKLASQTATLEECQQAAQVLRDRLNTWLQADSFRPLREKWLQKVPEGEPVRIVLRTQNHHLQKLPWHLWDLVERYHNAEIALGTRDFEKIVGRSQTAPAVRILAILGDSRGIDIQADRAILEQLPQANVTFLVEPASQDLTDQLWEQDWHILFFAGHSASHHNGETGYLYINPQERLTIHEMKYALRKAINRGLKLAIFNSCDGLGLAREFADLSLPQLIVMREPVPDRVAQEFLKYFLQGYAKGESLYQAVRHARERLQGLERQFPCATWLPVIYQNPAETPPKWRELTGRGGIVELLNQTSRPIVARDRVTPADPPVFPRRQTRWLLPGVISLVATLTTGMRFMGWFQTWELAALDHLMRLRPSETQDPRLFIVTVTNEDVAAQPPHTRRNGTASLSDRTLQQVLQKLNSYQPKLIGLDIYRDYPTGQGFPSLAQQIGHSDRLVTICRYYQGSISDPVDQDKGIAPPPELPIDPQQPKFNPDLPIGFSDFVLDRDQILRRHLLSLTPPTSSPCRPEYAFSTQLALRYLATQDIRLEFLDARTWKLGKAQFQTLTSHTGGYQGIDARGHQILLNYRAVPDLEQRSGRDLDRVAEWATVQQVLDGQISASAVKDRIVLIGTTAQTKPFNDYSRTPYLDHNGQPRPVAGVVLQAQLVSQLLSAAIDGRPLLWALPFWLDVLWIWGWAVLGGLLASLQRRSIRILSLMGALVSLYGLCLLGLIQLACWLPLVPAVLSLAGSSSGLLAQKIMPRRGNRLALPLSLKSPIRFHR